MLLDSLVKKHKETEKFVEQYYPIRVYFQSHLERVTEVKRTTEGFSTIFSIPEKGNFSINVIQLDSNIAYEKKLEKAVIRLSISQTGYPKDKSECDLPNIDDIRAANISKPKMDKLSKALPALRVIIDAIQKV